MDRISHEPHAPSDVHQHDWQTVALSTLYAIHRSALWLPKWARDGFGNMRAIDPELARYLELSGIPTELLKTGKMDVGRLRDHSGYAILVTLDKPLVRFAQTRPHGDAVIELLQRRYSVKAGDALRIVTLCDQHGSSSEELAASLERNLQITLPVVGNFQRMRQINDYVQSASLMCAHTPNLPFIADNPVSD